MSLVYPLFYHTQTINLNLDVPKSIPPNKFSEVAMPTLNPHDIAAAVIYALSSPPRVLVRNNIYIYITDTI